MFFIIKFLHIIILCFSPILLYAFCHISSFCIHFNSAINRVLLRIFFLAIYKTLYSTYRKVAFRFTKHHLSTFSNHQLT